MNKRIAVIPNDKAAGVQAALPAVCAALRDLGADVILPRQPEAFNGDRIDEALRSGDAAVALGGDGTIIHIAKRAARFERAVLGINCGNLGFMAGLETDELPALSALMDGTYGIDSRMMLSVRVRREGRPDREFFALNEAVVARGPLSRMIAMDIANNGQPVISYHADGVIVSTPTGSTAYSLSAGGPIVDPAVKGLLMTPICPHSLHSRAYIFREDAVLSVHSSGPDGDNVFLTVDGEDGVALTEADTVEIGRAEQMARLITIKPQPFYEILHRKLMDRR